MSELERPEDPDADRLIDPEEDSRVERPAQVGGVPLEANDADALEQALEEPPDDAGE